MTIETPTRLSLAGQVGEFVARAGIEDVPAEVLDRARHLVLDAVGLAFASTAYDFPAVARDALAAFGGGQHPVLGMPDRLTPRDAAVLNGVLIHGMDFDDTHIPAVTHVAPPHCRPHCPRPSRPARARRTCCSPTCSASRCPRASGSAARGLPRRRLPPDGRGRRVRLRRGGREDHRADAPGLAAAQGVVGSMSAGLLEFLEDGSWTKRLHPGWAAMSGLTAASFAKAGWSGPPAVYEGRFGLYASHLSGRRPTRRPSPPGSARPGS